MAFAAFDSSKEEHIGGVQTLGADVDLRVRLHLVPMVAGWTVQSGETIVADGAEAGNVTGNDRSPGGRSPDQRPKGPRPNKRTPHHGGSVGSFFGTKSHFWQTFIKFGRVDLIKAKNTI